MYHQTDGAYRLALHYRIQFKNNERQHTHTKSVSVMDPCNPPFSETDEMRETLTHDFIDGMSVEDKNEYIRWDGTTPVLNNHTLPDTMMNSLRVQNLVCPECDGYFTWNMWNGHTRTCKMAPSSCKYCGYQQPTYLVGFPHQIGCRGIGGSYHRCETEYWNSSHTPS